MSPEAGPWYVEMSVEKARHYARERPLVDGLSMRQPFLEAYRLGVSSALTIAGTTGDVKALTIPRNLGSVYVVEESTLRRHRCLVEKTDQRRV